MSLKENTEIFTEIEDSAFVAKCVDWGLWAASAKSNGLFSAKFTDAKIADRLGLSKEYVGKWRTGHSPIGLANIFKLIKLFNDAELKEWWDSLSEIGQAHEVVSDKDVLSACLNLSQAITPVIGQSKTHLDKPNLLSALHRTKAAISAYERTLEGGE